MKKALRILSILGLSLAIFMVIALLQPIDPLQSNPKYTAHIFHEKLNPDQLSVDSLWQIVGTNKTVPPGFEKAALVAYSAYPELKEYTIEMILTQSGAPMESNFELKTLFGKRENRTYQILLNNAKATDYDPILLRNLPFNAQVGILAHELGHTTYYLNLSTMQLAKFGIMYLISSDFRAKHERSTDLMPVYHGLGNQIYDYAWYVRNAPDCKPLYEAYGKEFIDKFYMTDKELKSVLNNSPLYQLR